MQKRMTGTQRDLGDKPREDSLSLSSHNGEWGLCLQFKGATSIMCMTVVLKLRNQQVSDTTQCI